MDYLKADKTRYGAVLMALDKAGFQWVGDFYLQILHSIASQQHKTKQTRRGMPQTRMARVNFAYLRIRLALFCFDLFGLVGGVIWYVGFL